MKQVPANRWIVACAVVVLTAALAAPRAAADEFTLKDGRKISGTIVGYDQNMFRIQTDFGYILIRKDMVVSIRVEPGGEKKTETPPATQSGNEPQPAGTAPASPVAPPASNPAPPAKHEVSPPRQLLTSRPLNEPLPAHVKEHVEGNDYVNDTFQFAMYKPPDWKLVEGLRREGISAIVALSMFATADHYRAAENVTRLVAEGRRYWSQHQDDRALQAFQQAASQYPRDERPHEELAAVYLSRNQMADAISEYNTALRLSPGSPVAQLGLAVAYDRDGQPGKARKLLEDIVGKNPQTPDAQEALADLCAEQRLYAEAIKHYQEAIHLEPGFAEARNNLAWLLATADDPKFRNSAEALKQAQRAVELSHWKEATFIDTLAEAFYANGQYQQAVATQKKALALDPGNKTMQAHMARYRKAAGA